MAKLAPEVSQSRRGPSFSVGNAQKYRFCATFILSDNLMVYVDD